MFLRSARLGAVACGAAMWAAACGSTETGSAELPGEYDDGVYHCCAEGDGTACCEGYEPGMCFEYGGIYGVCGQPGEEREAKVICGLCCPGLTMVSQAIETTAAFSTFPEGCGPGPAPFSLLVCVACGDGVCGDGENPCRCPEDCPTPAD